MNTQTDFRSDTVTRPSPAMRQAMAHAVVGDDVMSEDPTLNSLQEKAADIVGKEAALFVPSGTFANQVALLTWGSPGGEVYISEQSHIVQYEAGAASVLGGAFMRAFPPSGYWAEWSDFEPRIRKGQDEHFPQPALICLENALSNGRVQPLDSIRTISMNAKNLGIPVHMDGARLFNAACSLGVQAADLAGYVDSVSFCFSKGLGAPVGSIVCGTRDFIARARLKRKIMGGGMRQAGVLAAAAHVALDEERHRLKQDHEHAQTLARAFGALDVFRVLNPDPDINMVFVTFAETLLPPAGFASINSLFTNLLEQHGILTYPQQTSDGSPATFRFVTHRDISPRQMTAAVRVLPRIAEELKRSVVS